METCWEIGSQGDLSPTTTRNWIVPKIRGLEEDPKPQVRMQPRLTEWFQPWKNLSRYPCYTMPDHWPDITGRQYFFQVLHVWEFVPHQDIECSPSEGCHLHIVVGHEDSKAAEVGALAGGAVVSAVPGASTESHPWQRSCGEDLKAKANQDSRDPLDLLKHLPQNQSLSYYFMTFTNSSDINWGLSPTTFLWRTST